MPLRAWGIVVKRIQSELSTLGDLLRHALAGKQLSQREVQRRVCDFLRQHPEQDWLTLGTTVRHKLRKGSEARLSYEELLLILEVAEIESTEFFAELARRGKLSLVGFGPIKKDHWNLEEKRILRLVLDVKEKGSRGYLEARAELRRIELLRDENPSAAENAAWGFLEKHRQPGALVGALAILAVEAPRANAHHLLRMAFELLGPEEHRTAAGLKLATATGRSLYLAGLYQEALEVLERHALVLAGLFGSADEIALVNYYIGISASKLGKAAISRASLEQCLAIGSGRWQFAALQHMALEELNGGDIPRAAEMYDELITIPFFANAAPRAKAFVSWSRLTAHFLAGDLNSAHEEEFRQAVDEAQSLLDPCNGIAASLDLALFLQTIGKLEEARELLKAEVWNAVDLEDVGIQEKFAGQWLDLGLPADDLRGWFSRTGAKFPQPHPQASRPCLGRIPRLPAEGPKE